MRPFTIADDPLRRSRGLVRRLTGRRRPDHLPGEAPCRVLVGDARDPAAVRAVVADALGVAAGGPLHAGGLAVEVGANAHAGSGDAGRWPIAVELRPVAAVPHAAYVEAVTATLRGLADVGLRAVPLCPFADELPRQVAGRRPGPRTV